MSNFIKLFLAGIWIVSLLSCEKNPYRQGKVLYDFHCQNCHMEDGSGLEGLIPSLEKSDMLQNPGKELACLIRNGLPVNPKTDQQMPPAQDMSEVEMTNIINYLNYRFSTQPQAIKAADVKVWLASCQSIEN